VERRRIAYLTGRRPVWRASVPVIVVGNVTVGGTGKTPLVIWLARYLREHGHRPGIVSRGYGGSVGDEVLPVEFDADPSRCGDEPVLLARRTGCPVWIGRDRVEATRRLLEQADCTVVIADDGLQHYALGRDVEIAVVDGERRLGNGRCLPAGPLREPAERLAAVDWQVINGPRVEPSGTEASLSVRPLAFVDLVTGERVDCAAFAARHRSVDAFAGIGNPERFAATLESLGISVHLRALPDHHRFTGAEIAQDGERAVVCTEKDAVKLRQLPALVGHMAAGRCWYLEIEVEIDPDGLARLDAVLRRRGILAPNSV